MCIEKINNLIDQAPDVSQWWLANKKFLTRWFIGKFALWLAAFSIASCGAAATLLAYAGSLMVGKDWVLIAAPLVCGGGFVVAHLVEKFVPKKFRYNNFKLSSFVGDETASLAYVHEILSKAVTISDPQMKPILARLHILKDMDLPKCWWNAFSKELDNYVIEPPVVRKSEQEKIDHVFVQIQDSATLPPVPKVFRL